MHRKLKAISRYVIIVTTTAAVVFAALWPNSLVLTFDLHLEPLPASAASDDWPCRDHQCGCSSPEACRTNCCCFPIEPIQKIVTLTKQSQLPACHPPQEPTHAVKLVADATTPAEDRSDQAGLSLRSTTCAGTFAWLLVICRIGWIPAGDSLDLIEPIGELRKFSVDTSTLISRTIELDPPPPRSLVA